MHGMTYKQANKKLITANFSKNSCQLEFLLKVLENVATREETNA